MNLLPSASVPGIWRFLDASCARPVVRAFPCLQGEHHALDQRPVLAAETLGENRALPERQPDAVTILQQKRFGLVPIAKLLRVRPDGGNLVRGYARTDHID